MYVVSWRANCSCDTNFSRFVGRHARFTRSPRPARSTSKRKVKKLAFIYILADYAPVKRILHVAEIAAPRMGTSAREDEVCANINEQREYMFITVGSPGHLKVANICVLLRLVKRSHSHPHTLYLLTMTLRVTLGKLKLEA